MEKRVNKYLYNTNKVILVQQWLQNKDMNKLYLKKSLKYLHWVEITKIYNQE